MWRAGSSGCCADKTCLGHGRLLTLWSLPATPTPADVFGGLPVRFGSFLPAVNLFDAAAFAISDAEALLMDPQQRLLLEAAGELLLGQTGRPDMATSARREVGVFVGLSTVDYLKVRCQGRTICVKQKQTPCLQHPHPAPPSFATPAAHGQVHPCCHQRLLRHWHCSQCGIGPHQLRVWAQRACLDHRHRSGAVGGATALKGK